MNILGEKTIIKAQADEMQGVAISDMGCVRKNNEDNMVLCNIWGNKCILAVAIDGVGGQEGGEVAAAIAAESIPAYLNNYSVGDELSLLREAVRHANNEIYSRRIETPTLANMSCVLTAALIDGASRKVHMAHVGDTRLYRYYAGELRKLSHDHSIVGYREEVGDLTEEQAMHHPQRNIISRDVGSELHENVEFVEGETFDLLGDSMLMLCSDGLCDMITSKQMISILSKDETLEKRCQQLVDDAKEAGGRDNVTVVLVKYSGEGVVSNDVSSNIVIDSDDSSESSDANSDDKSGETGNDGSSRNKKKLLRRILIILMALVLLAGVAVACYLFSKRGGKGSNSDQSGSSAVGGSTATSELPVTIDSMYTSDKLTVTADYTSFANGVGDANSMSLSKVADQMEYTCLRHAHRFLPDTLTAVAVNSVVDYDSLVAVGNIVVCESHLVSYDTTGIVFSVELKRDSTVMAHGRSQFRIVKK